MPSASVSLRKVISGMWPWCVVTPFVSIASIIGKYSSFDMKGTGDSSGR